MNAKNPSCYSFKRKIRMITRHHQKIHKKTPIIVNNTSLPKSKQKKLWNLWPIIQDIYPVLFILFSISTEFLELKFIRKTMLPKKKRFRFYRFNRTVKHQKTMQKVAVKVRENKTSVISMNGGCVGNSCIAHAFIASTYTFFTYSPKSNIKSFSKWSHWRGIGFYCWIIMTKGKYTTKILFDLAFGLEKVWKEHRCRRQGRVQPKNIFFFSSLWYMAQYQSKWKQCFPNTSPTSHFCVMFSKRAKTEFASIFCLLLFMFICSHFACWKIKFFLQLCKTHSILKFYYDLSRHIVFNIYHKIMGVNLDVCLLNKVAFRVFLCKNDGDSNNFKVHLF